MTLPTTPQYAVIFDVDGVLIDSYDAHYRSWCALSHETGVDFSEAQFASTFGRTSRDILMMHWRGPGETAQSKAEDFTTLDERKEALFREIVSADFPAMAGAIALIDGLVKADVALAVGSSGPPENVQLVLDKLDRRGAFAAQVTGADVTRGKPDPEVFQLAATRLGAPAARCVVIEDAPAGIIAAQRAGMSSIALLSTGRTRADFDDAKPNLMISSLEEINATRILALIA